MDGESPIGNKAGDANVWNDKKADKATIIRDRSIINTWLDIILVVVAEIVGTVATR